MANILEVKDLCKTYVIDKRQNNVLRNVNFEVEEGDMVALFGIGYGCADKRNGLLCRQGYCEAVTDGACEGTAG